MRFARVCDRVPIVGNGLRVVLVIGGLSAYGQLPVAQYPEIAPPSIVVRASYPGADAETVAATVATPLEQEINGVEDMLYMSSYSTSDGSMALTITFDQIGRASCRERVCQYVSISVVAVSLKKTKS